MSRWISPTLLVVAGVAVLVFGAAAHGFEPTLRRASTKTSTVRTSTEPSQRAHGLPLRVSVVALLVDRADNSVAVVVRVANPNTRRAIRDAPVTIDLLDAASNVVGTNGDAGTNPLLVHVPYVGAGESVLFVSDTIATSAAPSKAQVTGKGIFSALRPARLAVLSPRLRKSPFGWVADGTLVSSGGTGLRSALIQAVVHREGHVVAAGTTVAAVPSRGRPTRFEIVLVGNAKGGELRIWAPPQ